MPVLRTIIVMGTVVAMAILFVLFYETVKYLYQLIPTIANPDAWVLYHYVKYFFYAGVVMSVAWLLLTLFNQDKTIKKNRY